MISFILPGDWQVVEVLVVTHFRTCDSLLAHFLGTASLEPSGSHRLLSLRSVAAGSSFSSRLLCPRLHNFYRLPAHLIEGRQHKPKMADRSGTLTVDVSAGRGNSVFTETRIQECRDHPMNYYRGGPNTRIKPQFPPLPVVKKAGQYSWTVGSGLAPTRARIRSQPRRKRRRGRRGVGEGEGGGFRCEHVVHVLN